MRLLTGTDISTILRNLSTDQANEFLDTLSTALGSYYLESTNEHDSSNKIVQPPRIAFQTKQDHGNNTVLAMPVSDTTSTVVKVATIPAKGDIAGAITIYSGETGQLEGVLNAAEITAFRTALASMTILTRWPAPDSVNFCVFGGGKQAEWHVRLALLLVPGIGHVTVVNRSTKRLEAFEQDVFAQLRSIHPNVGFRALAQQGNNGYQQDLRKVLQEAHIICGCTPSTEPLFPASDLDHGPEERFISLIGSYKPHMQEIDTETLDLARQRNGKIWVDQSEACLEEAGELIKAGLGKDDLKEIGELFSNERGKRAQLEKGRRLTLFKCVGFGFMDLVISKALLKTAEDLGKGVVVDAF